MNKKNVASALITGTVLSMGIIQQSQAESYTNGTVNASYLNVRSGPSTSYRILDTLKYGSNVKIVSESGGWYKIIYNNSYAYVSAAYIDKYESQLTKTTGYVDCHALNVRKSPTTSSSVLTVLSRNSKVSIVGETDGWYKIYHNNSYAYVYKKYIKIGSSNTTQESINKQGYVSCSRLNVRSGASTSYSVLGTVTKNQPITIVGESGDWYKIKYNYSYGYVSKNYVTFSISNNISNLDKFLFIGDSFTTRISYTIKEEAPNAIVKAKSGSRASYWIANFNQMPSSSSINGVNLLIGINGVTMHSNTTDTKKLIDMLCEKYPTKPIFVQKIFPIGKGYNNYTNSQINSFNAKVSDFNSKIKSYCSTKDNVKFVDSTSGFVDSQGHLINCDSDGLHIKWDYNYKLFSNMETSIRNS